MLLNEQRVSRDRTARSSFVQRVQNCVVARIQLCWWGRWEHSAAVLLNVVVRDGGRCDLAVDEFVAVMHDYHLQSVGQLTLSFSSQGTEVWRKFADRMSQCQSGPTGAVSVGVVFPEDEEEIVDSSGCCDFVCCLSGSMGHFLHPHR